MDQTSFAPLLGLFLLSLGLGWWLSALRPASGFAAGRISGFALAAILSTVTAGAVLAVGSGLGKILALFAVALGAFVLFASVVALARSEDGNEKGEA